MSERRKRARGAGDAHGDGAAPCAESESASGGASGESSGASGASGASPRFVALPAALVQHTFSFCDMRAGRRLECVCRLLCAAGRLDAALPPVITYTHRRRGALPANLMTRRARACRITVKTKPFASSWPEFLRSQTRLEVLDILALRPDAGGVGDLNELVCADSAAASAAPAAAAALAAPVASALRVLRLGGFLLSGATLRPAFANLRVVHAEMVLPSAIRVLPRTLTELKTAYYDGVSPDDAAWLDQNRQLARFDVNCNALQGLGQDLMPRIALLTNMRTLRLCGEVAMSLAIRGMTQLESLCMMDSFPSDASLLKLRHLSICITDVGHLETLREGAPHLATLHLCVLNVLTTLPHIVGALGNPAELTELGLTCWRLDLPPEHRDALLACSQLERLRIDVMREFTGGLPRVPSLRFARLDEFLFRQSVPCAPGLSYEQQLASVRESCERDRQAVRAALGAPAAEIVLNFKDRTRRDVECAPARHRMRDWARDGWS